MKREGIWIAATFLCVAALISLTGCGKLKSTTPIAQKDVAANVDGQVITLKDIDARISKMPAYYQQMLKGRKKELLEDMVLETLLFNEAKKRGLEKDKEVRELLEEAQKKVLISKLLNDEVENKSTVSDKDVEEYYNSHKDEFVLPERWKASHILLKTEAEAKAILDELSKGKSFEDLAKEKSQDVSAKRGGDVGYFAKGQMVPEFEEAASKLEVGKLSPIVKTQFGYHIIKLADKKPSQTQELKDVSARIKNELLSKKRRDAFDKLVSSLKAKAKITMNEKLLEEKQMSPAPTPTPAPEPRKPKTESAETKN